MSRITLGAMQWCALRDLREVPALNDADAPCLAEVREVLERHGKLGRFALHLIHKHFDLAPDEVLVEASDPVRREQWLRVAHRDSAELADSVATTFTLHSPLPLAVCVCAWRSGQGHLGRHGSR